MRLEFVKRWSGVVLALLIACATILRASPSVHLKTYGHFHYVVHIACFALLAASLSVTRRSLIAHVAIFLGVALLGLGTEYYESLHDGFPIEQLDVLADAVGAVVGVVMVKALASA